MLGPAQDWEDQFRPCAKWLRLTQGGISLGRHLWGSGPRGFVGSRQFRRHSAIESCALTTITTPHLKHLVDSFSCLRRCLKVKKAPALCPEPPLTFIHTAVLGAVDLDREKRQRPELSQGLQRQLEEHSSKADCLTAGKEPVWLERLFAYLEGTGGSVKRKHRKFK